MEKQNRSETAQWDIPILLAQEALCQTPSFTMLTRITGFCTKDPVQWLNPYAKGHYNNKAMTLIGETAGKNLGLYRRGLSFSLEDEPYEELKQ